MTAEPFYHDGEYVGTLTQADDGSFVVVTDDGQVVAAAGANGQPLNAADFAVDSTPPAEPDEPDTFDEPEPDPAPDHLEDAVDTHLTAGTMAVEHRIGRPLTNAERETITDVMVMQLEHGSDLDPFRALDVHHEIAGTTPPDLDDPDQRDRYMAERLTDLDRDTSPAPEIDTEPTDTTDMSLDELNAHMARQADGHAPLKIGRAHV